MNALSIIERNARMARNHPDHTVEMLHDSIHAKVSLQVLITCAEQGAAELARAGRPNACNALLAALSKVKDPPISTIGILKGNTDLVPAEHQTLTNPINERLKNDFGRLFDVTPNPKGAKPTLEVMDERAQMQGEERVG